MGINQRQLRTIIAYSSIGHLGWIIRFMLIGKPNLTIIYFIIYCTLIVPLFLIFNSINLIRSKQLRKVPIISVGVQLSISLILISLAGLPPLTGFMPKIIAILLLANYNLPLIIILIIGSLINLFFYLNIIINISVSEQNINRKIMIKPQYKNKTILLLSGAISMGLAPLIIYYAMTILNKSQRHWNPLLHPRHLGRNNWSRNKTPYSN